MINKNVLFFNNDHTDLQGAIDPFNISHNQLYYPEVNHLVLCSSIVMSKTERIEING